MNTWPQKMLRIFEEGKRTRYPAREVVQSTDASEKLFNYIKSGYIKRYLISNKGELGVQIIYGPGDMFPITEVYRALLNQEIYEGPETYYYESITEVEIYTIDSKILTNAVTDDPVLYRNLLVEAGKRLRSTLNGLENISLKNAQKRVAHKLVYYSYRFGEKTAAGARIQVPLTQQDLADILNLTRETVSTSISELRARGLIKTGRYIVVLDQKKLEQEAFN